MKRALSLKLSIALAFLLVCLILILGYSLLSVQFFFRGMDSIIAVNMEKAAQTYLTTLSTEKQTIGSEFSGYYISQDWQQQPEEIRQIFPNPPRSKAQIQKYVDANWFSHPDAVYFAIHLRVGGQPLYISRKATKADSSPLVGRNARANRHLVIMISIGIAVSLALIVWLLLRYISRPVSQLTRWTQDLSAEKLGQARPDFIYPELNQMAALIQQSLTKVHQSLTREQQFLRFTSHELRTPITVIRSNVELIHKLQQKNTSQLSEMERNVLQRIDRASLTMQYLSETLLWLSREDNDKLPQQTFRLDKLIQQLNDEMHYLLNNKAVEVTLNLSAYEITLSQVAARIVIGNLIRNAFQHTWEGRVLIEQQDDTIRIINHCQQFSVDSGPSDQGFGLGLQLTEKLCQKLHWQYQNTVHEQGHDVILSGLTPASSR